MSNGILILNKPKNITSHDAVARVRRLYGTKQVGHTGTLDPMATGVMCILVGRAVKASEYAVNNNKSYIAGLKLGTTTDTGDITGKILSQTKNLPSEKEVISAVSLFKGEIMQTPPMYSAIKIAGEKLCDLARKGITVKREARPIKIFDISCSPAALENGEYTLTVSCSKGTYIRSLCEDIGTKLGCGGTMSSLCRTSCGGFSLSDSHTLEELEALSEEERDSILIDTEMLFSDNKIIKLPDFFAKLALAGNEIYLKKIGQQLNEGELVRLYDDSFFSLGEVRNFPLGLAIKPVKKFRI